MARGKSTGQRLRGPTRRGGADEGGDDSQRWLTTYGDAVTLLLAFFVLLYSMSSVDVEKFEALIEGLAIPFRNSAGSQGMLDGDDGILVGDVSAEPTVEAPDPADPSATAGAESLEPVADELRTALENAGLPDVAKVSVNRQGIVIRIGTDGVLFASGSSEVSPLGERILDSIAPTLANVPNELRVEGHTDDVPIHSRPGYTNWNLSTDRAVAVLTRLYEEHAINQKRLLAAGYGEYEPLVPNDTGAQRSKNRRVEIIVVAQGGA